MRPAAWPAAVECTLREVHSLCSTRTSCLPLDRSRFLLPFWNTYMSHRHDTIPKGRRGEQQRVPVGRAWLTASSQTFEFLLPPAPALSVSAPS